jgi:hypothetical protein
MNELIKTYELAKGESFGLLPPPVQTVVMSVGFQYGSLPRRTPNFWRKVLSGDVRAIVEHLERFGDGYGPRRKREAAYIRERVEI